MTQAQFAPVLRHLRRLAGGEPTKDLTDAQLLHRFRAQREEAAFAALVQRHGGLVWSVCRRVLGHDQDAEDAFQATFLVLARHADSVRTGEAVAAWLYRVAHRIALRAGRELTKRRTRERQAEARVAPDVDAELTWRELQAVLAEELDRLPEKYRAPFILCCLEGKSGPEAARHLGWKVGTVTGRLTQARKQLRQRLARRGVGLAAALTAPALGRPALAVPPGLLKATTARAVLLAAEPAEGAVSAPVAALMKGASPSVVGAKLKIAAVLVLILGVLASGAALRANRQGPRTNKSLPPSRQGTRTPRGAFPSKARCSTRRAIPSREPGCTSGRTITTRNPSATPSGPPAAPAANSISRSLSRKIATRVG
jgi:RNA polymerase sigma factor (sigma-70 family)